MRWIGTVVAVFVLLSAGRAGAIMNELNALWDDAQVQNFAKLQAAMSQIKDERYDDAIMLLKGVIRAEPENADGWSLLAFALRKTGDFDGAMEGYTRALTVNPLHRPAREYLGELHLQLHDLAAAEAQLDKLTELCPDGCVERDTLQQEITAYRQAAAGG